MFQRRKAISLVLAAAILHTAHSALGAAKAWIGADGTSWNFTIAWSPTGVPVNGDDVTLGTQSASTSVVTAIFNNTYTGAGLNSLKINASGIGGTFTLSQTLAASAMIATTETIGDTSAFDVYTQTAGTNSTLSLTIGANLGANANYNFGGGTLTIGNATTPGSLIVANAAASCGFNQSGGNLSFASASNALTIGLATGSNGVYNLSGGNLTADTINDGAAGVGTFTQTGGNVTITNNSGSASGLFIGKSTNSSYNLSSAAGPASLSATNEFVGVGSTGGNFSQAGNTTNTVSGTLSIGNAASGSSNYILSGGNLTANNIVVGSALNSTSTINQFGGFAIVQSSLILGQNGTSDFYSLSGGTLTTPNTSGGFLINPNNTFSQSAGTYNGYLLNNGIVSYTAGTFNGTLENSLAGIVSLNGVLIAGSGVLNKGFITVLSGDGLGSGLSGLAALDNENGIILGGGSLTGSGVILNNGSITGFGAITGSGGFINNGSFIQGTGSLVFSNSGTNINNNSFALASGHQLQITTGSLINNGSFTLNTALVSGAGTLINSVGGTLTGGGSISSNFQNTGVIEPGANTLNISTAWTNNGLLLLTGPGSSISGSAITNASTIQGAGSVGAPITNNGTIEALGGTLALTNSITNPAGGTLTVSANNKLLLTAGLSTNAGVISLTGGTFDNGGKPLNNTNEISGYGIFRTGGAGLTNNGTINFTGSNGLSTTTINGDVLNNPGKTINVKYNPAIFTGNVTNASTALIKTTSTTATFAGNFTNNGTYLSDPSTNIFQSATANNGSMSGSTGDAFYFLSGSFNNTGNFTSGGTLQSAVAVTNSGIFTQSGPQSWSPGSSFTNTAGKTTFASNAKLYGLSITGGAVDLTTSKIIVEDATTKSTSLTNLRTDAANHSLTSSTATAAGQVLAVSDNAIRMANFPSAPSTFGGQTIDANSILVTPAFPGDANLDGVVDIKDLQDLANHWQQPATDWSQADFDSNGVVALQDLQALANHWQSGVGAGGGGGEQSFSDALALIQQFATSPVPEPASLSLAAGMMPILLRRRTRRTRFI